MHVTMETVDLKLDTRAVAVRAADEVAGPDRATERWRVAHVAASNAVWRFGMAPEWGRLAKRGTTPLALSTQGQLQAEFERQALNVGREAAREALAVHGSGGHDGH